MAGAAVRADPAKARVALYSELAPEDLRRAFVEPVTDLGAALRAEIARLDGAARVAVLPEGPLTIPYLASQTR